MLNGTKRLFPTDYKNFTKAMIEAANDDNLPVRLQLDELKDYTLKDIQDLFYDFNRDTSLDLTGHLFMCDDCGKMHLILEVDYPPEEENKILQ